MNTTFQQRGQALREIDRAAASGRDWRSLADASFPSEDEFLRAAQQRWFTLLGGAIENAIETGGDDLLEDVRRAYAVAVERVPGLRRILDAHAHHPAIEQSVRREHALVARAAGVAHSDEVTGHHLQHLIVPAPRRGLVARLFQTA